MSQRGRLTPISPEVAREAVADWDRSQVDRMRADGLQIQRELQHEAAKMRTLSAEDLKARSR